MNCFSMYENTTYEDDEKEEKEKQIYPSVPPIPDKLREVLEPEEINEMEIQEKIVKQKSSGEFPPSKV